jgi:hypothetical protein
VLIYISENGNKKGEYRFLNRYRGTSMDNLHTGDGFGSRSSDGIVVVRKSCRSRDLTEKKSCHQQLWNSRKHDRRDKERAFKAKYTD